MASPRIPTFTREGRTFIAVDLEQVKAEVDWQAGQLGSAAATRESITALAEQAIDNPANWLSDDGLLSGPQTFLLLDVDQIVPGT